MFTVVSRSWGTWACGEDSFTGNEFRARQFETAEDAEAWIARHRERHPDRNGYDLVAHEESIGRIVAAKVIARQVVEGM